MSVGNVVNADAPYFTKCEFSIGDNDELEEGRPFARNIDTDKMEGIKESHKRCAETYKASYVSHGGDYTAYIYNEDNTTRNPWCALNTKKAHHSGKNGTKRAQSQ